MKPNTKELTETMNTYCGLMQEVKIRIVSIDGLSKSNLPTQVMYECCYLQLRIICETIALACLVVHGDIPANTKQLHKIWEASKILSRLSDVHPDFYPHPVELKGSDPYVLESIKFGFLAKEDLINLYSRCGEILHRGSTKKIKSHDVPDKAAFAKIQAHGDAVVRLLQNHWIKLFNSDSQISVQMDSLSKKPTWNYWELMEVKEKE